MYYYAANHIPRYSTITTYPNDPEYNPNTNGVTNFSYAFAGMLYCKDTIGSIMNRFDWNSCTDMSHAFDTTGAILYYYCNFTGSIPNIPDSVTNMSEAFRGCSILTGSIGSIGNSVTDMSIAFYYCYNLTGSIPNIPNSVTNMYSAFDHCYRLTGSIPNIPNSVTDMSWAFSFCSNLTGSIGSIGNSVTNMSEAFSFCSNLTGSIPNIPNSVTDMYDAFYDCYRLSSSNVYIHSNNVNDASYCFYNMGNTMNIYVHANTNTYNSFYKAMGNSTYNAEWNCYLKTF